MAVKALAFGIPPLIAITLVVLIRYWQKWRDQHHRIPLAVEVKDAIKDPYLEILPVDNGVDLERTEPLKIRPFKPKYHLTMGLENITLSEFIVMDKTHVQRCDLRQRLIQDHQDSMIACKPIAEQAVRELYTWMVNTYLPRRFPKSYKLVEDRDSGKRSSRLHDLTRDRLLPTDAATTPPTELLKLLGGTVDTDLLFCLSSSTTADGSPIYHLEACVVCFPSGFSIPKKMGLPLAGIHGPVPGYAAKLERSMDRFFARMESGKIVKRANWSVTTDDVLYDESGTHMHQDDQGGDVEEGMPSNGKTQDAKRAGLEKEIEEQKKKVEIEKCRVRVERQTLHRLPESKALVFAFKTYQYRLEDVKAEGNGEVLADAIDGLVKGSVPEINVYKRGVVWSDKVTAYLRN